MPPRKVTNLLTFLLALVLLFVLAGCSVSPQSLSAGASAVGAPVPEALADVVEPMSAYVAPRPAGIVPTPTPIPETKLTLHLSLIHI